MGPAGGGTLAHHRTRRPVDQDEVRRHRHPEVFPGGAGHDRGDRTRRQGSNVDSLSSSGPLVTATSRVSVPGRSSAPPAANSSQNSRQVRQPLERKASRVWWLTLVTARWTAPPSGVRPARSAALPVVVAGPATPSRVVNDGWSDDAVVVSLGSRLAPRSWRADRMSAWLRNSPTTRMASRPTTTVRTTTSGHVSGSPYERPGACWASRCC